MQQRACAQGFNLRFAAAKNASHTGGVDLDTQNVLVSNLVLGINGDRKRLDRFAVSFLHYANLFPLGTFDYIDAFLDAVAVLPMAEMNGYQDRSANDDHGKRAVLHADNHLPALDHATNKSSPHHRNAEESAVY